MNPIARFGRFWYDFVIGDDPTVAIGVSLSLIAVWIVTHADINAWWLLLAGVGVSLAISVYRVARAGH